MELAMTFLAYQHNMKNDLQKIVDEQKPEVKIKKRQIIIEFDEKNISYAKTEIASAWELKAILTELLKQLG